MRFIGTGLVRFGYTVLMRCGSLTCIDTLHMMSFFTAICPELDSPAFGSVTWTGRSVGSNVTYTCYSDYNLVGNMTGVCELLDVGIADWSVEAPICERTYAGP